jgi:hypothetical protein
VAGPWPKNVRCLLKQLAGPGRILMEQTYQRAFQ